MSCLTAAGLHNLDPFLAKYGFEIGDDIIIDKLSQVFGANYLTPVVTEYEDKHPLTRDFNVATFFPIAFSGYYKDPSKRRLSICEDRHESLGRDRQKGIGSRKGRIIGRKGYKRPLVTIGAQ